MHRDGNRDVPYGEVSFDQSSEMQEFELGGFAERETNVYLWIFGYRAVRYARGVCAACLDMRQRCFALWR